MPKKKILLVNPPRINDMPVIREDRCEIIDRNSVLQPYSLLQLGSILRDQGHVVKLIDANGFNLSYEDINRSVQGFDVLIFRFTPTTFKNDTKICDIYKKKNNGTSIGISYTLDSVARDVLKRVKNMDIFVGKNSLSIIPDLINNIDNLSNVPGITYKKNNTIIRTQQFKDHSISMDFPMPAFDLLASFEPYYINTNVGKSFSIVYSSQGCPFLCKYCTVANSPLKIKPASKVIDEIRFLKRNYNIELISFFDETFTINRKRVIKICEEIKKLNIKWYCNTRATLLDKKLLGLMKKAGCDGISLGIESGSQKILDNVSKGIKVQEQKNGINLVKKAGIKVYCSFIFGLPGETKETIEETINFLKETLPTSAQFNIAVPYPGTELHHTAEKNGWLKNKEWEDFYQDEISMIPGSLTPEDLISARKRAYKTLYFNPRWIFQNVIFVIKNPADFKLALYYSFKIFKNYLIHGMKHAQ
ncbi:radical SAM protein [Candidatus Woesearchaeota archaeon]|nr:radical SAM protein [Candidatus Woesearchaeota archaeon]